MLEKVRMADTWTFSILKQYFLPFNPFPNGKILDASKLKEFADDNFRFVENGRKLSKQVENTVGKEKNAH